ncbi:MAG: chromate transporter [Deinococcus sp.]
MDAPTFVAGYGAVQAMPGPLFSFATYLGAAAHSGLNPLYAASICTLAVFLPAGLLVAGALPFWHGLRSLPGARPLLDGLNAGVVGLLLATLYTPVFTSAVHSGRDLLLALLALAALLLRVPSWAVVLACLGAGWAWPG